jgi:GTP cyclohydrolase I
VHPGRQRDMTGDDRRVSAVALAEPPDPARHVRRIDHGDVQRAARDLLEALGADVDAGGVAHVAYLPGDRIIGLSKLGRVVELFSRDLQIQERLTTQVAEWLQRELEPKGVGVVLEAEHLCMSLRGVQNLGAKTVTSALRGLVRDDARTRQEFLALTTRSSHEQ